MSNNRFVTTAILVALGALMAFGVLYGLNSMRVSRTIERPLQDAFALLDEVEDFELVKSANQVRIVVNLRSVPDLQKAYEDLDRTASEILGKREFEIEILDHRNSRLERCLYAINGEVYEAVSTGGFSSMTDRIDEKLSDLGIVQHRVVVDPHNVYVQIHDGDDYLYEIVPRSYPGKAGTLGANIDEKGVSV